MKDIFGIYTTRHHYQQEISIIIMDKIKGESPLHGIEKEWEKKVQKYQHPLLVVTHLLSDENHDLRPSEAKRLKPDLEHLTK